MYYEHALLMFFLFQMFLDNIYIKKEFDLNNSNLFSKCWLIPSK